MFTVKRAPKSRTAGNSGIIAALAIYSAAKVKEEIRVRTDFETTMTNSERPSGIYRWTPHELASLMQDIRPRAERQSSRQNESINANSTPDIIIAEMAADPMSTVGRTTGHSRS